MQIENDQKEKAVNLGMIQSSQPVFIIMLRLVRLFYLSLVSIRASRILLLTSERNL